jgi:hypothetical protein
MAGKGKYSDFPQHSGTVSKSKSGANLSCIEMKMDIAVSTTPWPVTRPKDVR